ncbi:MAG: type II secretion system ATPase GspE [Deltaproteobacteria bacterium]|nr:type II secretion system ATPase GspE [Deltaproteobacteria bacterium]
MAFRGRLGQILLEHTSLNNAQLEEALQIQKETGERLGVILVSKGYITPEEVLRAMSIQVGVPYYAEIPASDIDAALVKNIPINFAKQHDVLPLFRDEEKVTVVVSDPLNFAVLDDLRLIFNCEIQPVLATKEKIQEAINRVYERKSQETISEISEESIEELSYEAEGPVDLLEATEEEAPVIRLVNQLLFRAVKERASDIHIEPYERELSVRYRIDGVLYEIYTPPKRFQSSITSRIKVMANLNIAEKRLPQDGRIRIKIAGKEIDIRVSTIPTTHGERIVMRILDKSNVLLELPHLGFSPENLSAIKDIVARKHGIFLVTGPTGSGKSTTLYACLAHLNNVERNIITVEDPVEYQIKGIGQIPVNPKINMTFASGLRAILRQDPDVIMVGEIRDVETAEIAVQASLTGHLVLSTLHTNDAPGALTRLVDMQIEPFLVSSSILAVMAQRLVRRVCKQCHTEVIPSREECRQMGIEYGLGKLKIYKAVGCENCIHTGYSGRSAIYEMMIITDNIRRLIAQNADASVIKKQAIGEGMKTLRDDGIRKVLEGVTTLEEVLRVTQVDIEKGLTE